MSATLAVAPMFIALPPQGRERSAVEKLPRILEAMTAEQARGLTPLGWYLYQSLERDSQPGEVQAYQPGKS